MHALNKVQVGGLHVVKMYLIKWLQILHVALK